MPRLRRSWLFWSLAVLVLLIGGCTAHSLTLGPTGRHAFVLGGTRIDVPLESPTLLGWLQPGERAFADDAQVSLDGRTLYVIAFYGACDALASASVTRQQNNTLVVDLRLTWRLSIPDGCPLNALPFATRIGLDPPVDLTQPLTVLNAGGGDPVQLDPYTN